MKIEAISNDITIAAVALIVYPSLLYYYPLYSHLHLHQSQPQPFVSSDRSLSTDKSCVSTYAATFKMPVVASTTPIVTTRLS